MSRGSQKNRALGMKLMTRGMMALIVTLTMVASFLLPFGGQMALAEDDDFLSVAALQSETIKTVTAEESTGLTFKGKKFQVFGQGACDIFGAEIASGDSLVISSLDGTAIKSVDIHFGAARSL